MAASTILVLYLFGFYLVKNSIERDMHTGVGQIIATTPISRPAYLVGKWLSNWAVLAALVVILAIAAILMQLFGGEASGLDLVKLLSPFALLVLPAMAIVAAVALLFETIPLLRGGFGNVVYIFFVWMAGIMAVFLINNIWVDWMGMRVVYSSMGEALKAIYPAYSGGFMFGFKSLLVGELQTFDYEGIRWTIEILASRFAWVAAAAGLVLSGSLFFRRFDPSLEKTGRRRKEAIVLPEAETVSMEGKFPETVLTPLTGSQGRSRFGAVFLAELRMFLKGQSWWWYVVAAGLLVAQLFTLPEASRLLLALAWTWQVLLLSALGSREKRFDTHQLVFSSPHPLTGQLPATWLSAFTVTALLGSGVLMKSLAAGDWSGLLVWLGGALFVPSLALFLGVLTGGSKAFEVVYILWMYLILQKTSAGLDFVGLVPASPWYIFVMLAALLAFLAVIARGSQLRAG